MESWSFFFSWLIWCIDLEVHIIRLKRVVIYGIAFRIQKDFGYGSLSLSYYVLESSIDDIDTYSHIYFCVVLFSM